MTKNPKYPPVLIYLKFYANNNFPINSKNTAISSQSPFYKSINNIISCTNQKWTF